MQRPGVDHAPELISWLSRRTSADLWNTTSTWGARSTDVSNVARTPGNTGDCSVCGAPRSGRRQGPKLTGSTTTPRCRHELPADSAAFKTPPPGRAPRTLLYDGNVTICVTRTSVVKKSAPAIAPQCARRNVGPRHRAGVAPGGFSRATERGRLRRSSPGTLRARSRSLRTHSLCRETPPHPDTDRARAPLEPINDVYADSSAERLSARAVITHAA